MAELADAHGLGPCAARRAGSSPVPGTSFHFIASIFHRIRALPSDSLVLLAGLSTTRDLRIFQTRKSSLAPIWLESSRGRGSDWLPQVVAERREEHVCPMATWRSFGLAATPGVSTYCATLAFLAHG